MTEHIIIKASLPELLNTDTSHLSYAALETYVKFKSPEQTFQGIRHASNALAYLLCQYKNNRGLSKPSFYPTGYTTLCEESLLNQNILHSKGIRGSGSK